MIDLPYAPPALPEQAIPPTWKKSLKRGAREWPFFDTNEPDG